MNTDDHRPGRYVPSEQHPPNPRRVTDNVVVRFDHIVEVEPGLMEEFPQQTMPAWDTKRISAARMDHLDDIHRQFADNILLAGEGPDTDTYNNH